jgi:hypothetical protein
MKGNVFFRWAAALGLALLAAGCEQTAGGVSAPAGQVYEEDGEIPVYEKLAAIEIASAPDITYYAKGQPFDTTGLTVNGVYYRYIGYYEAPEADIEPDEAVTRILHSASYTVTAPDTNLAGPETVLVRCGDFKTNFNIYVDTSTRVLSAVTLNNPQAITTAYELGREFSKSDLRITAAYYDSETGKTTPVEIPGSMIQVLGYNRRQRGEQKVTLRVNGNILKLNGDSLAKDIPVTVTIPAGAAITPNSINAGNSLNSNIFYLGWQPVKNENLYYKPVYIKGTPVTVANLGIRVNVKANGETYTLTYGHGITDDDPLTGVDYTRAGIQRPVLKLDSIDVPLDVFFTDAAPEVWFDYGFMRHNKDTGGTGLGAGKYYVTQGQDIVLSPVRFLIGYGPENNDVGATYSWKVNSVAQSVTTETFAFTPPQIGTYTIEVSVTGRHFVTGESVTKTATTQVVSFTGPVTDSGAKGFGGKPLKNFSPGQFTKGGTGHGWSLGTALGYEMWPIPSGMSKITIQGNGFPNWSEPGIVWVQADDNGNGLPDEMWYEITGSEETSVYKSNITRRYAIKHYAYDGTTTVNEYGQPTGRTYWTDSKGRHGAMIAGWPDEWGVDPAGEGVWVTYTGTILRDGGKAISLPDTLDGTTGYIDSYSDAERQTVTVDRSRAIRADGAKANIGAIRFVKVQTGIFSYGHIFGDHSTEIVRATGIEGDQSNGFPNPLGSVR